MMVKDGEHLVSCDRNVLREWLLQPHLQLAIAKNMFLLASFIWRCPPPLPPPPHPPDPPPPLPVNSRHILSQTHGSIEQRFFIRRAPLPTGSNTSQRFTLSYVALIAPLLCYP